jgi:hypothetical protein
MTYIPMNDLVCFGGDGTYYGSICQRYDFRYVVGNITWYTSNATSEFVGNGVLGLGRPNLTDSSSQGFLAQAYRAGLINSTTWAIINSPDYAG